MGNIVAISRNRAVPPRPIRPTRQRQLASYVRTWAQLPKVWIETHPFLDVHLTPNDHLRVKSGKIKDFEVKPFAATRYVERITRYQQNRIMRPLGLKECFSLFNDSYPDDVADELRLFAEIYALPWFDGGPVGEAVIAELDLLNQSRVHAKRLTATWLKSFNSFRLPLVRETDVEYAIGELRKLYLELISHAREVVYDYKLGLENPLRLDDGIATYFNLRGTRISAVMMKSAEKSLDHDLAGSEFLPPSVDPSLETLTAHDSSTSSLAPSHRPESGANL